MDAVITPHRSLSSRGVIALVGAVTLFDTLLAVLFVMMGAGPIPIFLGIGLLGVIAALYLNNRAAEQRERIMVTMAEVRVVKEARGAAQTVWISPTALTRISLVDEDDDNCALRLHLSNRALSVAEALSRRERRDFARALENALRRARGGHRDY
jgi:uncharacterized membrane protein